MLETRQGIYIYGGFGTGKTHLAACMANALIGEIAKTFEIGKRPEFPPVLLTNMFEIAKSIKATFGKNSGENEQSLIEKFSGCDFLFFDDLGKEILTKNADETWLQGLLFDLLNRRYNELKPTIFTSNFGISELISKRGPNEATADRIEEMSKGFALKISGNSRR